MGCTQSKKKIEKEETVGRCKERKQLMKAAVSSRSALAAAHSAYVTSLRNTGAAFHDFAQAESPPPPLLLDPITITTIPIPPSSSVAAGKTPMAKLPRPPPPLPNFPPPPSLQRSNSMPDLPVPKKPRRKNLDLSSTAEEEEEDDDARVAAAAPLTQSEPSPAGPAPLETKDLPSWAANLQIFEPVENMPRPTLGEIEEEDKQEKEEKLQEVDAAGAAGGDHGPPVIPEKTAVDPPMPQKSVKKQKGSLHHHHAAAAASGYGETRRGKMVAANSVNVNLLQILTELDDHFLKAYESAQEVSRMLEANRMHYHSNFADNRGHIDHSTRVMHAITWNRSLKGIPNADEGKTEIDSEEWETHATVLDKLLAWEKKLFDEVKASELTKLEYQRKVASLNKQKKHGANPETLEKIKASVSHLHTRYIVDMQSMDSTVSEIERLRDDELYPKLSFLVDGMARMWETMYVHHHSQLKTVIDIKSFDISNAPKEMSEQHYDRTVQLYKIVSEWHLQFQKLVTHQRDYIQALNSWLKLNLIPIETSFKDKVSSPPRVHDPPIQDLIHAWHDQIEKLPDELAKAAIFSFSTVVNSIMVHQQDELKQKDKCEELRKDYMRKSQDFEDWYHKYSARKMQTSEVLDPERTGTMDQDPVAERQFVVDSLKKRLEDELEQCKVLCKQAREKSVTCLKMHLPELFRALSEYAYACSDMYKNLRTIAQANNATTS